MPITQVKQAATFMGRVLPAIPATAGALLLSLLWAGTTVPARAASMQVVSTVGPVSVVQQGQSRTAGKGERIDGEFSLVTADNAYVQLRSDDGALIDIPENSEMRISQPGTRRLELLRGGVNLLAAAASWTAETPTHQVRSGGYLRLRLCAAGCSEAPGLYGKSVSGEAVVEYRGGRSVLRGRTFRAPPDGGRPQVLPRDIVLLADNPRLETAAQAKTDLASQIKSGLDDFKAGHYDQARQVLSQAQQAAPAEPVLAYYLGLIALEKQDNAEALKQLERYHKDDPEAAQGRGVGQIITLLTANKLQEEVAQALKQEQAISAAPPEPNTIAVQPFSNRSDPAYAPLAKGIAAMIITDLSKVPGLKVLEREKVQKIFDEIRLGSSGLVEGDTMVRAGRLMRAEKVFVGSFGVQR